MGTHSASFPRDITHAVSQLYDGPGPHLVDATAEAKRLIRMFPDCSLTVEQLSELIIRESTHHAGDAVKVGGDGSP
jgi:hypothetical protein